MTYFRVADWAMMRFGSFFCFMIINFYCQCLHTRSSVRVHSTLRQKNIGDTSLSLVFFHVISLALSSAVSQSPTVSSRGFVDSLPACKASDAFVLSLPDFTPHRMRCRFGVFGDSLESAALILQADFRFFSRGHDTTTHVRRARLLTDAG